MQRPEVRIVQNQHEESNPIDVSGYEAEQLLRKYGYKDQSFSTIQTQPEAGQNSGLTFEEMVAQENAKIKEEEMRKRSKLYGPKPTTFDPSKGYDAEIKSTTDEDTGFGFTIQIVSDMPIPKR